MQLNGYEAVTSLVIVEQDQFNFLGFDCQSGKIDLQYKLTTKLN